MNRQFRLRIPSLRDRRAFVRRPPRVSVRPHRPDGDASLAPSVRGASPSPFCMIMCMVLYMFMSMCMSMSRRTEIGKA